MPASVVLMNPKNAANVSNVLRACSNFGAVGLAWTPERVPDPDDWPRGTRMPREERMRLYRDVVVNTNAVRPIDSWALLGWTPVAVEVREAAESLPEFEHPANAVYVFGPEDGELGRGTLEACHRFVVIPTTGCINLAAAVNVVLYDRLAKLPTRYIPHTDQQYGRHDA